MALISKEEVGTLGRPVYTDPNKIDRFIDEAEQMDVKKALGDVLFRYIVENKSNLAMLLDGGSYTDGKGASHQFAGLKKALAYYVYSRLVTSGNIELTRAGSVNRSSDYSQRSDWKEREYVSRESASIADNYLRETIGFIRNDATLAPMLPGKFKINSSRNKFKIVGK